MNKKRSNKTEYSKEYMNRSDKIAEGTLAFQSDSFNAIDSKSQTYISVIALFLAILLGFLALSYAELSCELQAVAKLLTGLMTLSYLVNIILFFLAIKSKDFKSGLSPEGLNNMQDDSIDSIDKEIFSNNYWSAKDNLSELDKKSTWLKRSEYLLIMNFVLSFALIIFLIIII